MEYKLMKKAYMDSLIVQKGDYPYFVNSLSDGNPEVTKELLEEVMHAITSSSDLDCDVILAPEAMGIPYATALTMWTGIPFKIIRKRKFDLPDEITVEYSTGYSSSKMYINAIKPGVKAIIVDDVLSTGGTMKALVKALREHGVTVNEAIVILNKSPDIAALEEEIGIKIVHVMDVAVEDGRPVVLSKG